MSKKKIYCGSGKKRSETWITGIIYLEDIEPYLQPGKTKRFVKLNINILDTPDKFGNDVEITVNDWQPNQVANDKGEPATTKDDLPF